ncbi:poly [ADP-ribose] polymerase tankyrase-1-like isoform X2 [Salvia hispanica]|uniref:poly [ADP-ribose] polymerase tankyrase-1-like isoform X2 n=1 Tax=Salvia hispanica TaxID=49212 RepID=UPI0020093E83|nr:poly [ADP-ribose] polymerase tankyrase-1-like isoform X2 [Salvia hispanica]
MTCISHLRAWFLIILIKTEEEEKLSRFLVDLVKELVVIRLNAMGSTSEIAIIEAAAYGHLNQLKAIRKKVDDEWEFRKICDEYSDFSTGRNVLHHAAEIGHFEICKFLINNVKVYTDALTYKRVTPLAEAAKRGHVKIVELLIKHGADISLPNIAGVSPLHHALLKDNMELVDMLLVGGALVEVDSSHGTPLQIAISRGNVEAVRVLLFLSADPNFYLEVLDTPLVCAVKSRSSRAFECLNMLLEVGADPNLYCGGSSPLTSAAKEGDTKFLKRLLEAGSDPNSLDIFKPIEEAAIVHNRAAVEILFPVTERIAHYPNWTVDGIIEYIDSEDFRTMSVEKLTMGLTELKLGGMHDASNKEYEQAMMKYKMASHLDPSNPTLISKRSLWEAHLGLGNYAVIDALKWFRLKPDLTDPIHLNNAAAANEIFKKFLLAGLAFSLDPHDNEACFALGFTMFDCFALLCQMSSPHEIMDLYCFPNFRS